MHSSFFILHTFADLLKTDLDQAVLQECFSPQQDELCLVFQKKDQSPFYIKVLLKDTFQCVYAPLEISKPRHNIHSYFRDVYGFAVAKVYAGSNDRSLVIEFVDGSSILFKMYASRSNVLLLSDGKVTEMVKKVHARDLEFSLDFIHKELRFSLEQTQQEMIKSFYVSAGANAYIKQQTVGLEGAALATKMQGIYNRFATEEEYHIQLKDGNVSVSLWKDEHTIFSSIHLYETLNTFIYYYFRYNLFQDRKRLLQVQLQKKIEGAEKYIKKTSEQLLLLYDLIPPNETADIIMANLHDWPEGVKERELFDFYRNTTVKVLLKERLSPQKMAEHLYKKAKNRHRQFQQLESILNERKVKAEQVAADMKLLEEVTDYKALQAIELKYHKEEKISEETFPFKQYTVKGFEIWVGRNAANNELLTLKYAHKEDLWLHARNVPGSHVVIKHQAGKAFPQDVLEKAASLAAYYSTLKNDTLCPVSYTHKKYVRKFKGGAIGSMKMDREEVIMVMPADMKERESRRK